MTLISVVHPICTQKNTQISKSFRASIHDETLETLSYARGLFDYWVERFECDKVASTNLPIHMMRLDRMCDPHAHTCSDYLRTCDLWSFFHSCNTNDPRWSSTNMGHSRSLWYSTRHVCLLCHVFVSFFRSHCNCILFYQSRDKSWWWVVVRCSISL